MPDHNPRSKVITIKQNGHLRRVTPDVDDSIVSTGLQVAWAKRGFNAQHCKVPSYYPIFVHVAQTGQILAVRSRPGNVHDGKRSEYLIRDVLRCGDKGDELLEAEERPSVSVGSCHTATLRKGPADRSAVKRRRPPPPAAAAERLSGPVPTYPLPQGPLVALRPF